MRCATRAAALSIAALLSPVAAFAQAEGEAIHEEGDDVEESADLNEEDKAEAKRLFNSGGTAFAAGDYRRAIEDFQRAYDISHLPEILYNMGRCHEELGDGEEAIRHYEFYLHMKPDSDDREAVLERIEDLSATADEEETETSDEPTPWEAGIRLGAGIGASATLTGDWRNTAIPLDVLFHYPLVDWLYLSASLAYGSYLDDDAAIRAYEAERYVQGSVGLAGLFELGDRVALTARLDAAPTWVFRSHRDGVFWLAFHGAIGAAFRVYETWCITLEARSAFGPAFPRGETAMAVDVGGLLGLEYRF